MTMTSKDIKEMTPHPPESYGVKSTDANSHCISSAGSVAYAVGDEIQLWDEEWYDIEAVTISENWPAINTGDGLYWPSARAITGHKPQNPEYSGA